MISGHQEFFFLAVRWAGYFFPFFSHKLSITFAPHPFFFSNKRLQEIFFHNIIGDELLLNSGVKLQR